MPQQQEQAAIESYAAIEAALRQAAEQADASREQKPAGETHADDAENPVALTAVFSTWRRGVKALLGDMAGLAAAEGKLAAVGAVQLLLGVLILVSLASLALLWLEVALGLALYTLALPPLVIALLLCGVNLMLAAIIVWLLKPLTANFSFEHTRQMLNKEGTTDAAVKVPKPTKQPIAAANGEE